MGLVITADIEGAREMSVELSKSAQNIKSFRAPLSRIGGEMLKTFQLNYAQRGALFGGWAPRKKAYPWPLLEKTGRMRSAFRSNVHTDHVVLDNPTPYFKYHQSNRPRTRLPRRVMMKMTQQTRNMVIKTFQRHIVEATRR